MQGKKIESLVKCCDTIFMNSLLAPKRVEEIKHLANQALDSIDNESDPLKRVMNIAEKNGIQILQSELYEISGALRKENNNWKIYVNSSDSPQRKLFTIAHELGHFFAHKEDCDEFIDGQFIARDEQEKYAIKELEANEFAGNLIMPEKDIKELATGEITSEVVQSLAKTFGVSTIAIQTRLHNLGYDTPNKKQRAA